MPMLISGASLKTVCNIPTYSRWILHLTFNCAWLADGEALLPDYRQPDMQTDARHWRVS